MRGSQKWVALGIAMGSLALWPAAAGAAPIDRASDHAALVAYHGYLEDVLSSTPAIHTATDNHVSSIAARCPGVLTPLNSLPPGSVNQGAALSFTEELGGDLAVAAGTAIRAPFAQLAATLRPLRWSTPQTGKTIRGYLTAERRMLRLGPSRLCADLKAFAASNGQQTPAGTDRWLAKLAVLQAAQQSRLAAFQAVLERFRSPADAGLVADSERIQRRFGAAVKSILMPEAKRLLSALGLSS